MIKLWAIVKENVLFLFHYRREHRRREEELAALEVEMGVAQIEFAFAMLADQKAALSANIQPPDAA